MIKINCPYCSEETTITDSDDTGCGGCGEEVPMDYIIDEVTEAQRDGVPFEPTGR